MITKNIRYALLFLFIAFSISFAEDYDLYKVSDDVAALYGDLDLAYWDNHVYGKESDIEQTLAKYAYLTANKNLLDYIKTELDEEGDVIEKRKLRLLYLMLVESYFESEMAPIHDEINNRETNDRIWVTFRDEAVPYRGIYSLFLEDDEERVKETYFAFSNYIVNVLNPLHRNRLSREAEVYEGLGFASATDFFYTMHSIDRNGIADEAYSLIERTEDIKRDMFSEQCREVLGKEPGDTMPWERSKIYQSIINEYDEYFPKEDMIPFTYGFFGSLGFDITEYDNIYVDSEDRPEKQPRAACYTVSVPGDIRVNLKPMVGIWDYFTALHEFGHALHYANTSPDIPQEFRIMGTSELTETYAMLFNNMYLNEGFLFNECGIPENKVSEFIDYTLLANFGAARSLAFSVIYEAKLHDNRLTDDELLKFYTEFNIENRIFPRLEMSNESYYLAGDDKFNSLNYMTAWYAEAQLRSKLEELYGELWYKDPEAGDMLRGLFAQGDSITVDQMLQQIGYEQGLDAKYLIEDFGEMYARFKETSEG
ncbi:MAG: hypothetical protein GY771_02340 [bacterium]|nr:hypothetical protein [bacterium]